MPQIDLCLRIFYQHLGEGRLVCEAVSFPEFSFFGIDEGVAERMVIEYSRALAEERPPRELSLRHPPGKIEQQEVTVTLQPPRRTDLWREPVPVRFTALLEERDGRWTGRVPPLQVAVTASSRKDLIPKLQREVLFALQRTKASRKLESLVQLQRVESAELREIKVSAEIRTPRQAVESDERPEKKPGILDDVATDMLRQAIAGILLPAYEIDSTLEAMVESLAAREARSVLLVGPAGVGKTAAVYELVRQAESVGLHDYGFWSTSGARLISGAMGFGAWQERCTALVEELARRNKPSILYVGNLIELTEVGKSEASTSGIAAFLRPAIARGQLLVIAECTSEQATLLERTEPQLLAAFRIIKMTEPPKAKVQTILSRVCTEFPVGVDHSALAAVERLHRRYGAYSPFPGRAVRFLRNLLSQRQDTTGQVRAPGKARDWRGLLTRPPEMAAVEERDVVAAFAGETGLPLFMLDDEVPLDLAATQAWFENRLKGQAHAVQLLIDLLATVKAGLARPRRPIASLMFIGPTGVGKTEMSKALAEFFFSDRSRLTRFDMSEYATPYAVGRLIGGTGGEGLLTAAVRQQPFSVLLLDEIEKAHGSLFDLLLQVFGEGRLTDASGRLADFSNALIIMTSNLGAESFGRGGFGLGKSSRRDIVSHFVEEVRSFMRPELFNRIDRIVPFMPLSRDAIDAVAARELALVQSRDGIKLRGVEMSITPAAAAHLARTGYDERYGARPLKRALERQVLAPLAEALNAYADETVLRASVDRQDDAIAVQVQAVHVAPGADSESRTPREIMILRRRLQQLEKAGTIRNLHNEIDRLASQVERVLRRGRTVPELHQWQRQLAVLTPMAGQLLTVGTTIRTLENEALGAFYGTGVADHEALSKRLTCATVELWNFMVAIHAMGFANPDRASMMFLGKHMHRSIELARIYHRIGFSRGATISAAWFGSDARGRLRFTVEDVQAFLANPPAGAWGFVLGFQGKLIMPLLAGESGSHLFLSAGKRQITEILVTADAFNQADPPEGAERPGGVTHENHRRTLDLGAGQWTDHVLDLVRRGSMEESIIAFVNQSHAASVEGILAP